MRSFDLAVAAVALALVGVVPALAKPCPPDAVQVGPVCVDKYEASVWRLPAGADALVRKIQRGKATLGDLQNQGAVQLGAAGVGSCDPTPYTAAGFPQDGNWTSPLYAVSIPGVVPSACVSWFQSGQACALAGKRLIRNDEWQWAAAGTPDPGSDDGVADCNVASSGPSPAGARAKCVSRWGAYDMIGNLDEWVGDWAPRSSPECPGWGAFSDDFMCLSGGDASTTQPGALFRGGLWFNGPLAGIFGVGGHVAPTTQVRDFGFRCVRP